MDALMMADVSSWEAGSARAPPPAGLGPEQQASARLATTSLLYLQDAFPYISPPSSPQPIFAQPTYSEYYAGIAYWQEQSRFYDEADRYTRHGAGSMLVDAGNAPTADAFDPHHVTAAAEPAPTAPTAPIASPPAMDVAPAHAPVAHASLPAGLPLPLPPLESAASEPPAATAATATAAPDLNGHDALATATSLPPLDAPVSLPAEDMHIPMDFSMVEPGLPFNPGCASAMPAEQRLSAFARLRFDDGSYYMHTYQIILGRNVQLSHKDMRRLAKVEQLKAQGDQHRAEQLLNNGGRRRRRAGARSVISEAGGIVNAPIEMMPIDYQQRRQSEASHSLSSGSQTQAHESNNHVDHAPQEMLMQALPEVPHQIDSQVPEDPNDCPLVPIHPQHVTHRTGYKGPKGISRQHAKIYYDFDHGHFCLAVLGSNGLYHEDNFLSKGDVVELNHGDTITIGLVEMTFFLPDIALTEEQRLRQESGSQSRPMSFSFENGRGESENLDDSGSEDQSVNPRHVYHYPVGSEFESDEDLAAADEDMDDIDEEELYTPQPAPKPNLKIRIGKKYRPEKPSKGHKRKAIREATPEDLFEEPPVKKTKVKVKEKEKEKVTQKDKDKEKPKEKEKPKATKTPTKTPAKAPAKAPVKSPAKESAQEPVKEETKVVSPPKEPVESAEKPKSESPVIVRRPQPGVNIEDLDAEGLITPEMCAQYGLPHSLIGQYMGKRKGPGRPPKDGVMSKRQRSQLIKQGKEIEKARAAGIDLTELPQPVVKPKAARRKDSNAGVEDEIRESTEQGDGIVIAGDKKPSKPTKPTRTPSPEMRIEDYTEEQLQRPAANYVVLIHEAISSAPDGQMNLQAIYNYIEKHYPWYKFKTTTSGWQSSVRHNLGQHDAFIKGDKEGKGYLWKINPNVSIDRERKKKPVSPPPVNHAQRPAYYPPPGGYAPYGQPGYYPGLPPQGIPAPPVEAAQPRLPPSMARNAAAAPPTAPAPSPYASPWAGGASAGTRPSPLPAQPYPPSAQPPVNSAAPSGQYGVLYPTSTQQGSATPYTSAGTYTSPFATAGPSPYGVPNGMPSYTPYPPTGPPAGPASAPAPISTQYLSKSPTQQRNEPAVQHAPGRYPPNTDENLIRQLDAFRRVYLQTRIEPGEDAKVDNAIRAYLTPEREATLTPAEASVLAAIKTIPNLDRKVPVPVKQEEGHQPAVSSTPANTDIKTATPPTTTAAIAAADAAANTSPNYPAAATPSQPQNFAPSMTTTSEPTPTPAPTGATPTPAPAPTASAPKAAAPNPALVNVQTQRPSVEPITPVPGSPAMQNGTPVVGRPANEVAALARAGTAEGAQEPAKVKATPLPTDATN